MYLPVIYNTEIRKVKCTVRIIRQCLEHSHCTRQVFVPPLRSVKQYAIIIETALVGGSLWSLLPAFILPLPPSPSLSLLHPPSPFPSRPPLSVQYFLFRMLRAPCEPRMDFFNIQL